MKRISRGMAAALFTLLAGAVWAAVPDRIVYQGRLTKSGVSASGAHVFRARFLSSAGLELWESGNIALTLPPSGDFTLELSPTGVDWLNDDPKLEITVDGDLLSPSGSFASSPYALAAKTVENGAITRPKVNTASFESAGHGLVPPGAIIIWTQSNTCPPGYSRVNLFDGRFPRGAAAAGTSGGAETHEHGMDHTHALPGHFHGIDHIHGLGGADAYGPEQEIVTAQNRVNFSGPDTRLIRGTGATGSGDVIHLYGYEHGHSVGNASPVSSQSGSAATVGSPTPLSSAEISHIPPFYDSLFCSKD
ncbi:MAG: hypothetical protein ACT4O3_05325 [Elusimicrobiota bacterium]